MLCYVSHPLITTRHFFVQFLHAVIFLLIIFRIYVDLRIYFPSLELSLLSDIFTLILQFYLNYPLSPLYLQVLPLILFSFLLRNNYVYNKKCFVRITSPRSFYSLLLLVKHQAKTNFRTGRFRMNGNIRYGQLQILFTLNFNFLFRRQSDFFHSFIPLLALRLSPPLFASPFLLSPSSYMQTYWNGLFLSLIFFLSSLLPVSQWCSLLMERMFRCSYTPWSVPWGER